MRDVTPNSRGKNISLELLVFDKLERRVVCDESRMDFASRDVGVKNWVQRCEINRHKYFESQRLGYDIAMSGAATSFVEQYAAQFGNLYDALGKNKTNIFLNMIKYRAEHMKDAQLPDFEYVHSLLGEYVLVTR